MTSVPVSERVFYWLKTVEHRRTFLCKKCAEGGQSLASRELSRTYAQCGTFEIEKFAILGN